MTREWLGKARHVHLISTDSQRRCAKEMVDGPRKLSKQASEGNRHYEKGKKKLLYDITAGRRVDVPCMIPSPCADDHHKSLEKAKRYIRNLFNSLLCWLSRQ